MKSSKKIEATQLRMPTFLPFTGREMSLGRRALALSKGHDVLFHGTHHAIELFRSGRFIPSSPTFIAIPFTRSPFIAAYFALMEGGEVDGFSGAVLVLNRKTLSQMYRIEPIWDEAALQDEQEEIIRNRNVNFRRHLIGVVREAVLDNPRPRGSGRQPPRAPFLPNSERAAKRVFYEPLLVDAVRERFLDTAILEKRGVFRKLEAMRARTKAKIGPEFYQS
ncbi:hypothetical protein [Bradyrhizobium sp. AUGA SZCCT0182]|uniref:hypothetical protein n=1 Tax=Bradyrhizobium sp. AUGA SZCCT0182 TaxID=2807667 RepID=UPI001BA9FABE|nr:hypothetical protein [Bradyrhizobium sp. AUGA SZCCT0182]MBR1235187.1 hypothetical protein [Bradyrhizobium sp. AUGA SZCCT0182]